ncbi:hypothetical protein HK414_15905 [Ramlibacter terrae]|uniref:Uncharacterized protein n=1 Tax=Ramlibacter terrae TaxID=2732511 RepID=A0ABX6P3I3_9BURK|nr:hypothetical protein HK414_15905 [Ramlibacter terrae]
MAAQRGHHDGRRTSGHRGGGSAGDGHRCDRRPTSSTATTTRTSWRAARWATGAIGSDSDTLDLSVNTLTAKATTGGLFIAEANGLVIDSVSIAVDTVATTGVSSTGTATTQKTRSPAARW